jgi:hypothetical protein
LGSERQNHPSTNEANRELCIDIPDDIRGKTPLHGITTEKSFWLNNGFEEGVPTRYSQEKNLSRKKIPMTNRVFP